MKLVLCGPWNETLPCIDWPTAIIGLRCRSSAWEVVNLDWAYGKAYRATFVGAVLRVARARPAHAIATPYLTPEEIDRLMAGEDL
jgi:hypothetical protein